MMLFREFRFYSAVALAVTREDDFSFDAYAKRRQLAVIIERAVICVDDGSRYIPRRRINVEGADGALVVCGGIAVERRLGSGELFAHGLHEFELHFARLRQPCAVADDLGVEAETLVLIAEPFGYLVACFRARQVRLAGEVAQVVLSVRGIGDEAKFSLQLPFGLDVRRQEARNIVGSLRAARHREREQEQTRRKHWKTVS